jgi:hypothetical protein
MLNGLKVMWGLTPIYNPLGTQFKEDSIKSSMCAPTKEASIEASMCESTKEAFWEAS